jgi:hypothetical protein
LKPVVVSEWEKAHVMCQVGIGKTIAVGSVETFKDDIETEASNQSWDESGGCPFIGQVVSGIQAT